MKKSILLLALSIHIPQVLPRVYCGIQGAAVDKPNHVEIISDVGFAFPTKAAAEQTCYQQLGINWSGKVYTNTDPHFNGKDPAQGVMVLNDVCVEDGDECACSNTKQMGLCLKNINGKLICNCNNAGPLETRRILAEHVNKVVADLRSKETVAAQKGNSSLKNSLSNVRQAIQDRVFTKKDVNLFWSDDIIELGKKFGIDLGSAQLGTDEACRNKFYEADCICGNTGKRGNCWVTKHAPNMKPATLFCHCD